jgi:hypothetical protein
MKKNILIVLLAVAGGAFFTSCEKEPPDELRDKYALADTYWVAELDNKYELMFTYSTVTCIYTARNGNTWIIESPYTYDPPMLTMEVDMAYQLLYIRGTATDNNTLKIKESDSDYMPVSATFKKQEPEKLPTKPIITGLWRIKEAGDVTNGATGLKPYSETTYCMFGYGGKGWVQAENNYQESFDWSLSESQLTVTGWKIEQAKGVSVSIEPSPYIIDEEWMINQLITNQLVLSYWIVPIDEYFDDFPTPKTKKMMWVLERVK